MLCLCFYQKLKQSLSVQLKTNKVRSIDIIVTLIDLYGKWKILNNNEKNPFPCVKRV